MKLSLKRIEIRKFVESLLLIAGLSVSFPKYIEVVSTGRLNHILYRFSSSIYTQIIICLLVFMVFRYDTKIKDFTQAWFTKVITVLVSIFYGVITTLGMSYQSRLDLSLIWASKIDIVYTIVFAISVSVIMFKILTIMNVYFNGYSNGNYLLTHSYTMKSLLRITIIMLCCWIPMMYAMYPGVIGWDGFDQINQFFGSPTIDGMKFYLTNHHPVLTTIFIGSIIKGGMALFGSFSAGVFLYTLVSNIIMSTALSYLTLVVRKLFSARYAKLLFVFFTIFPIFSFWASTVEKTGLYISSTAFLIASFLLLMYEKGEVNHKYWRLTQFALACFGIGITRNDGLIYVVAMFIGIIFIKHTFKKKILGVMGISILFLILFFKFGIGLVHSLPSEPAESLAVPMQQISRVIKDNPQSISNKQRKTLNNIMKYDNIKKAYQRELYDSVKGQIRWKTWKFTGNYKERREQFDNEPITKNKLKLLSIWVELFPNNIKAYTEAFVSENIFYLFPKNGTNSLIWNSPVTVKYERTAITKDYTIKSNILTKGFYHLFENITGWPIVALLFSSAMWSIGAIILSYRLLIKYGAKHLPIIFLSGAMVAVPLVGPLNAGLRYYFSLMILVPILLIIVFTDVKKKQNSN